MQSLPSELKHLVVELCSESPNSLAALARTHTSYQREAEMESHDERRVNLFVSNEQETPLLSFPLLLRRTALADIHLLMSSFIH